MDQNIPTFNIANLLPPFKEISMPSAGLFPEVPATLHVRGFTVKELKQLTGAGKVDRKAFDGLLRSCIKESIDLSTLLVEDYNYLVFMVRLATSGNKATGTMICENPACNQQFTFDYNIEEFATIEFAKEEIQSHATVELKRFKKEHGYDVKVEVRRLLRADILKMEKAIKDATMLASKLNQPVRIFPMSELLKSFIVSIDGFPQKVPVEQFVDVLKADEAELLTSQFNDQKFGVSGVVSTQCTICGTDNTYDIPFTESFFR